MTASPTPSISIDEVYALVYELAPKHLDRLEKYSSEYAEIARRLVESLPDPTMATTLEKRFVMQELILGQLEWAFQVEAPVGTLGQLAFDATTEPFGGYELQVSDYPEVRLSRIWPFSMEGRSAFEALAARDLLVGGDRDLAEKRFEEARSRAISSADDLALVELFRIDGLLEARLVEEAWSAFDEVLEGIANRDPYTHAKIELLRGEVAEDIGNLRSAQESYDIALVVLARSEAS